MPGRSPPGAPGASDSGRSPVPSRRGRELTNAYGSPSGYAADPFADENAAIGNSLRPSFSSQSLSTLRRSLSNLRPDEAMLPGGSRPYAYNSSRGASRRPSTNNSANVSQVNLPLLGVPPSSRMLADMLDRYPSSMDLSRDTSRLPSRRNSLSPETLIEKDENDELDSLDERSKILGAFAISSQDYAGTFLDKEDDDYLHDPRVPDRLPTNVWWRNRRGLMNMGALILLLVSSIVIFILIPALTYTGHLTAPPIDQDLINSTAPMLSHIRTSMIDPDTPQSAYTKQSVFGKTYKLVFSDEFNQEGRTFYPGDDQFWEAVDIRYGATQDLEWYDPDAITTRNGSLVIKFEKFANHGLDYRSGMLQSWNKLCFKGGMIEVSASLPGSGSVPGLWPGIWTLGNLGRAGYLATTDGTWPYSYSSCDAGITANQSQADGLSYLPGQRLSSCTCSGAEHPNPGTGRGAPEIDVIEATVGAYQPDLLTGVVSQSLQTAPFDLFWMSNSDYLAVNNVSVTNMNSWNGGPYQQALSGVTTLNRKWYEGNAYQTYAFDYVPGGKSGRLAWHVGADWTWQMLGAAVGPNGNINQRLIPVEPMSIILNLGMSNSWVYIDKANLQFPATMYIDHVRIYQDPDAVSLTCDPPGFPTTQYIANHPVAYTNPNLTKWKDAGYSWPKSTLTGC
ncbi:beta-glucan synthesis-associated protein [Savitreella phatthalungensis]